MTQTHPLNESRYRLIWLIVGLVCGGVLCFSFGYIVGYPLGNRTAQVTNCHEQWDMIRPILAANPPCEGVKIHPDCDGDRMMLQGEIKTERERQNLLKQLTQAIGHERASYAVQNLVVLNPDKGILDALFGR